MVDELFDFAVNCVLSHDGVVLLQFHTIRVVLAVLFSDVAGSAGKTAVFMLCTFQDNLNAVAFAFLCHGCRVI